MSSLTSKDGPWWNRVPGWKWVVCVRSCSKYLLSVCDLPSTVFGSGVTARDETKSPPSGGLWIHEKYCQTRDCPLILVMSATRKNKAEQGFGVFSVWSEGERGWLNGGARGGSSGEVM